MAKIMEPKERYTREMLHRQIEEMAKEISGLLDNKEALEVELESYQNLATQKSGEADRFLEKSHHYAKENEDCEKHLHAYKATLENEQGSRKNAEIREGKYRNAWDKLIDILDDNGILGRIKGWYWHIKWEQPVYVDDISIDGMTGFALNLGSDGRFLGSVTDTFDYAHLIRIDRNLDNPF